MPQTKAIKFAFMIKHIIISDIIFWLPALVFHGIVPCVATLVQLIFMVSFDFIIYTS
jgi:hypothetical protein